MITSACTGSNTFIDKILIRSNYQKGNRTIDVTVIAHSRLSIVKCFPQMERGHVVSRSSGGVGLKEKGRKSPRLSAAFFISALAAIMITSGFSLSAEASGGNWTYTFIDSVNNVGQYASIAIDGNGNPHIAYYDATSGVLKHAYMVGGVWVAAVRDSSPNVGQWSSIAVDSENHVHISYYDAMNKDLKYVTNASGFWDIQTVAHVGDVGQYSSIAVDQFNRVHISFYDATNKNLMYANNTAGSWVTEVVDEEGDVGLYSSIALDSQGTVYIAYYDATNRDLKYATSALPDWGPAALDGEGDVGQWASIAVDSGDRIHISYYDATNGQLKYITDSTGIFTVHTIDSTSGVGQYSSITIDQDDHLHICYYSTTDDTIRYATNKYGNWTAGAVLENGGVGKWNSIAVSEDGNVHIATYDTVNAALLYIRSMNELPTAPRNVQTNAGDGFVLLMWEEPVSSGGAPVTEYRIYRGTSPLSLSLLATVEGGIREYNDTLLENDQTYYYQISAVNSHGEGSLSEMVQATPTAEGIPPSAPANLVHEDGDGYVLLMWDPPVSSGSAPVTGYRVYRGLTPVTENMAILVTLNLTYSYNDTSVENGQIYYYSVRALNSVGWGEWSEVVEARPQSPNPPTVPGAPLSIHAEGSDNYINITWEPPADNGGSPLIGYRVYRGTSPGSVTLLADLITQTHFNDTTVIAGETYYYQVSAVNGVGEGAYAAVSATAGEAGLSINIDTWVMALFLGIVVAVIVIIAFFYMKGRKEDKMEGERWSGPRKGKPPRSWQK